MEELLGMLTTTYLTRLAQLQNYAVLDVCNNGTLFQIYSAKCGLQYQTPMPHTCSNIVQTTVSVYVLGK